MDYIPFLFRPFYGGGILDLLFDVGESIGWLPLILIPIISWTLKPFVVKDKS